MSTTLLLHYGMQETVLCMLVLVQVRLFMDNYCNWLIIVLNSVYIKVFYDPVMVIVMTALCVEIATLGAYWPWTSPAHNLNIAVQFC